MPRAGFEPAITASERSKLFMPQTATGGNGFNSVYSCDSWLKFFLDGGSFPIESFFEVKVKVRVRVTLRLTVYCQSVHLDARPLETHDQRFIFQLNFCGTSPYGISSLTRRWVCLLWICLAFRQVFISHILHVIEKCLLLQYAQVLCQCRADHAYFTYLTLQRQSSHLNGSKLAHFQV
jgi:hypothetical protein